jgi:DNA-binding transcriptional ArsR family regulator
MNDLPSSLENVAEILKALGNVKRLEILAALTTECESVSAIVERANLPQPLVSHNLRLLRDRGLVRAERRGSYVYY